MHKNKLKDKKDLFLVA